jgi:hypothetical protein
MKQFSTRGANEELYKYALFSKYSYYLGAQIKEDENKFEILELYGDEDSSRGLLGYDAV